MPDVTCIAKRIDLNEHFYGYYSIWEKPIYKRQEQGTQTEEVKGGGQTGQVDGWEIGKGYKGDGWLGSGRWRKKLKGGMKYK